MPKNVILVVIDTLRPDCLGYEGQKTSPSPTIDRLARDGLVASNMFAVGCPTTRSLPGIFTSTYPLDNGGYDGFNREDTLAEVLKNEGYETAFFWITTILFAGEHIGRGFNRIYKGGTLFSIIKAWSDGLKLITPDYVSGKKPAEQCFQILETLFLELTRAIKEFCQEKVELKENGVRSVVIDDPDWQFKKAYEFGKAEEEKFRKNPHDYVRKALTESAENRSQTLYQRLIASLFNSPAQANNAFDFISQRHDKVMVNFAARMQKIQKLYKTNGDLTLDLPNVEQASAGYMTELLLEWIKEKKGRPFFAYFHLHDVHPPCNFTSFDLKKINLGEEWDELMDFYRKSKFDKAGQDFLPRVRYLFSVKYVDMQIRKILDFLKSNKLLNDTVIAFTADHGTHYPGNPHRDGAHVVTSFFDEFYYVPMVFYYPGIEPKNIKGLVSSVDLAPTLLDILGISSPNSFKGQSVLSPKFKGREFVFFEKNGDGYCDLKIHPVTLGIRNQSFKIVYESKPGKGHKKGKILECYDLRSDPREQQNLANTRISKQKQNVKRHLRFAQKRIEEIYR